MECITENFAYSLACIITSWLKLQHTGDQQALDERSASESESIWATRELESSAWLSNDPAAVPALVLDSERWSVSEEVPSRLLSMIGQDSYGEIQSHKGKQSESLRLLLLYNTRSLDTEIYRWVYRQTASMTVALGISWYSNMRLAMRFN